MTALADVDLAVVKIVAAEIYPNKGWIAIFEHNTLVVILNRDRCYRSVRQMFEAYGEQEVRREVHNRRLGDQYSIRFVPFDLYPTLESAKKALQANANG